MNIDQLNALSPGYFPGWMGITITELSPKGLAARMGVRRDLYAPNGFLHAGSIVTLADTACGYGCIARLPEGATGFTTLELKSNHLGTALDGNLECVATAAHLGRTTQVWDAVVTHLETGKTMALFRCTQMVLYPK